MNKIYKGQYYFYLECYTYFKLTDNKVLLLNVIDNQKIISSDKKIVVLIERLSSKKNSVLKVDLDNEYKDNVYKTFFKEVRDKFMGDLIDIGLSKGEPVNFYPIAKIEDNVRKIDRDTPLDFNLLCNSIFILNFFLNSVCVHNCTHCKDYYKQLNCCSKITTNNDQQSIEIEIIEKIFKHAKFENLKRINFLGGDISLYQDLDRVISCLSDYREICRVYFKYNNIQSINEKILSFFGNRISIIVDAEEIDHNDVVRLIHDYHQFEIHIVLTDELQIEKIMPLINSSISYKVFPFYNEKNISFIENNVFLSEKDIFEPNYTIKKIHRNQHMNTFFFGNLTLLPDGNVCIDVNGSSLGDLHSESIFDIISKALKYEDSLWFKTRDTTDCSDCLFVDLCPPISNYEFAINKSHLCNIK